MPLATLGMTPQSSRLEGVSLKYYKIIWKKCERIKKKIILGEFKNATDIMGRDGGNKTQRLYRCRSNYTLLKLIVDNGLEDL